jgi:hypothetical protein
MSTIYLIRRKSDGLYFKKTRKKYGKKVGSNWTTDPAKAYSTFSRGGIVTWFLESYYGNRSPEQRAETLKPYEVVTFKLAEVCAEPAEKP